MKRQILTVFALMGIVVLAGCKKQQVITPTGTQITFTASTDGGEKTILGEGGEVLWVSGDKIKITGGSGSSVFDLIEGAGNSTGKFTGTIAEADSYFAVYPSTANIGGMNKASFTKLSRTLTEGSFGNGAAPMVGKATKSNLNIEFKNVMGGILVRLYCSDSKGARVDYIKVTSNDGYSIDGCDVDYSSEDLKVTGSGSSTITLIGDPVTLSTDSNNPTCFYVMIPAGDYPNGFTVLAKLGGENGVKVLENSFTTVTKIERSDFRALTATETNPVVVPEGAISGLFTINGNGDKVYFSKGNLQYIRKNGEIYLKKWRFADNQWDYLSDTYYNSVQTWFDRMDLFGWSTTSVTSNYGMFTSASNTACYEGGFKDWGNNKIENGGNTENEWRTLTKDEWYYIFKSRNKSGDYTYTKATLTTGGNEYKGVIIFPDGWTSSTASSIGVSSTINFKNNTEDYESLISADDWQKLEDAGCVFLPAAGYRFGTKVYKNEEKAETRYWSSISNDDKTLSAFFMKFSYGFFYTYDSYENGRKYGQSVRLVRAVSE